MRLADRCRDCGSRSAARRRRPVRTTVSSYRTSPAVEPPTPGGNSRARNWRWAPSTAANPFGLSTRCSTSRRAPGRTVKCGSQVDVWIAVCAGDTSATRDRVPRAGRRGKEVPRHQAAGSRRRNSGSATCSTGRPIAGPVPWSIRTRVRERPSSAAPRLTSLSQRRCLVSRFRVWSDAIRKPRLRFSNAPGCASAASPRASRTGPPGSSSSSRRPRVPT